MKLLLLLIYLISSVRPHDYKLENLPREISDKILSYVDEQSLQKLLTVNKKIHLIVTSSAEDVRRLFKLKNPQKLENRLGSNPFQIRKLDLSIPSWKRLYFQSISNCRVGTVIAILKAHEIHPDQLLNDCQSNGLFIESDYMYKYCKNVALALITRGINLNHKNKYGMTPLTTAFDKGRLDIAQLLLHFGANANLPKNDGSTPLMMAVNIGNLEMVKLLIKYGADVNSTKLTYVSDHYVPGTALMMACRTMSYPIAETLIKSGCNVEQGNRFGVNPLGIAAQTGNVKLAKLLISYGANVNTKDRTGQTPLMIAVQNHKIKVAELLLNSNASVNEKNMNGLDSLMIAAEYGHLEAVKLLLSYGADPNQESNSRSTSLIFADKLEILKELIAHQAKVNHSNTYGKSALSKACEAKCKERIRFLVANNAKLPALQVLFKYTNAAGPLLKRNISGAVKRILNISAK